MLNLSQFKGRILGLYMGVWAELGCPAEFRRNFSAEFRRNLSRNSAKFRGTRKKVLVGIPSYK